MNRSSLHLFGLAVFLPGFALVMSCTSTGGFPTGWGEITLAPGDTGTCLSTPCRVYFQTPPGEGKYLVTANEVKVGEFAAGQTVMLGSFSEANAIRLPGTQVPPTYLYVYGQGGPSGGVH
jgi:hypothetical protein